MTTTRTTPSTRQSVRVPSAVCEAEHAVFTAYIPLASLRKQDLEKLGPRGARGSRVLQVCTRARRRDLPHALDRALLDRQVCLGAVQPEASDAFRGRADGQPHRRERPETAGVPVPLPPVRTTFHRTWLLVDAC